MILNLGKALGLAGLTPPRHALPSSKPTIPGLGPRADPAFGAEAQVQVLDCLHAFGEYGAWQARQSRPGAGVVLKRCQHDAEPLAERNPPLARAADRLRDAWRGEAKSFTSLAKYPDALAAWDQAVATGESLAN